MQHNCGNIPNDVDEYTASVDAELHMEACNGGDALKNFEAECLWFFSIDSDHDNIVDLQDDAITPPPKECKRYSCNAVEYEFGDV